MFKQLLISIILGALLGLILTTSYFYYKRTNQLPPQNQEEIITEEEIIIKDNITENSEENEINETKDISTVFIEILTPENESIIEKSNIVVSGKTMPNSIVIVNTPNNTFHTNANNDGQFDIDIKLESGINILHFTAISPDDSQIEKELLLTYSSAKI